MEYQIRNYFKNLLTTKKKLGGKIIDFCFRNKLKGQGMSSKILYSKKGMKENKYIIGETLSYCFLFLNGYTYRENCYLCPFATEKRRADVTLGDYWGFYEEYPFY